ncbi:hypothetical protein BaRGS_00018697 [Batillaria attramentaria]|uniref:Uncharacterized protein n=1 Tax=Batillaria attramentaria TaxID=370345 RepID=A0ABD0KSA8_9CAEN
MTLALQEVDNFLHFDPIMAPDVTAAQLKPESLFDLLSLVKAYSNIQPKAETTFITDTSLPRFMTLSLDPTQKKVHTGFNRQHFKVFETTEQVTVTNAWSDSALIQGTVARGRKRARRVMCDSERCAPLVLNRDWFGEGFATDCTAPLPHALHTTYPS